MIYNVTILYLIRVAGELRQLYKLSPIAVIGGSFFPGLAGHNISEAAAAGCAVLTGENLHLAPYVFHLPLNIPFSRVLFCDIFRSSCRPFLTYGDRNAAVKSFVCNAGIFAS